MRTTAIILANRLIRWNVRSGNPARRVTTVCDFDRATRHPALGVALRVYRLSRAQWATETGRERSAPS